MTHEHNSDEDIDDSNRFQYKKDSNYNTMNYNYNKKNALRS